MPISESSWCQCKYKLLNLWGANCVPLNILGCHGVSGTHANAPSEDIPAKCILHSFRSIRLELSRMFVSFRCVICMVEFVFGDHVRYLPCLHYFHTHCIDSWLMRSFICPSCMEPVDAALLITYESNS